MRDMTEHGGGGGGGGGGSGEGRGMGGVTEGSPVRESRGTALELRRGETRCHRARSGHGEDRRAGALPTPPRRRADEVLPRLLPEAQRARGMDGAAPRGGTGRALVADARC
ncbi:hypothetical protein O3P69_010087 [Scylla paramamosain]|uniref:Uncharacterized protein n=1 Tax=Scylla paramamosain TaxID=85552 RepID=A0AAW0SQ56_SCYPA